jgi:acetylglutamate kinase
MAVAFGEAFSGQWFVVKIGGELALDKPRLAQSVGRAVRTFLDAGIRVAVVHGAGPQATQLTQRLGMKPKLVGGRRVTDEATLEVVKMTLAGQVAVDVASAFRIAGVPALCTTGVSAGLIEAVKRPPSVIPGEGSEPIDLGWVGDVVSVNTGVLEKIAAAGLVPVLASISGDASGNIFNINADTVATRVAAGLKASRLFLVSNVPGVLRDKNDPKSRISKLTPEEATVQIRTGAIQGGMVPKVEESLAMLHEGIGAIHIVGIDPPQAVLEEAKTPGSFGTVFVREGQQR